MTNRVKVKRDKVRHSTKRLWNAAISEAKRHLVLAKRRVDGLEKTIENWMRLRDEGMPWPGLAQIDSQEQDQQHSV